MNSTQGDYGAWRDRLAAGEFHDQPFLLYSNFGVTHENALWSPGMQMWGAERRLEGEAGLSPDQIPDPAKVRVPSYLPDHYEVRQDIARFYAALAVQDQHAGELLEIS